MSAHFDLITHSCPHISLLFSVSIFNPLGAENIIPCLSEGRWIGRPIGYLPPHEDRFLSINEDGIKLREKCKIPGSAESDLRH
jgi:hypothetical protein